MRRLREQAARQGRTVSDLVNELLVEGLRRCAEPEPPDLPSFAMGRPRVVISDRDDLEVVMDD